MRLKVASLLLVTVVALHGVAPGQNKRALLIGIDIYSRRGKIAVPSADQKNAADTRAQVSRWQLPDWPSLEGAVNDALAIKEMLTSPKFGFPAQEPYLKVLTNQQATRQGILDAMHRYLVDEPAAGDTVVFYYAGHGSLRYNSKTSKPNHLDETIVPSDANRGVFDIRDKEIRSIFDQALDKGIKLTAIFDSCHSGSIARGIPLGRRAAVRFLGYDPRDANDPDDPARTPPEDREDNAALVFMAAQHDQLASEWDYDGEAHGAFTLALLDALRALPADTAAADIFKRLKVVMQGMGLSDQQPAIGGTAVRLHLPLFGAIAEPFRLRVAVAREGVLQSGQIVLDGGKITGIGPGSELRKVSAGANAQEVRIRVVKLTGINSSYAEKIGDLSSKLEPGDLFELDRWVPVEENRLQVWIPPSPPSEAELRAFVAAMTPPGNQAKLELVQDPSPAAATHLISWSGAEWVIRAADGTSKPLGKLPTIADVVATVAGGNLRARVFIQLPPSKELAAMLPSTDAAVTFVGRPELADYFLVGRLRGSTIEYAWILREGLEAGKPAHLGDSVCAPDSSFPLRSDWIEGSTVKTSSQQLSQSATALAKVKLWLTLPVPPGANERNFPYQLALRGRSPAAKDYAEGYPVIDEQIYDLVLRSVNKTALMPERKWVYVLNIACNGQGTLLFPMGGEGNHLPEKDTAPSEIPLTASGPGIRIGKPLGLDTYVLLITGEQLPDAGLLNFDAIATRSGRSPLEDLLGSASSGRRAQERPVPTDWSVRYLQIRSVAKDTARPK